MAKISGVNRLVEESFPKDVQPWIGKLIGPINIFLASAIYALTNHLTFADNFVGQQQLLDFTYQGSQSLPSFLITMKATPVSLQVLQATENVTTPVHLTVAWKVNQNGQIQVTDITRVYQGAVSLPVVGARYQILVRITP